MFQKKAVATNMGPKQPKNIAKQSNVFTIKSRGQPEVVIIIVITIQTFSGLYPISSIVTDTTSHVVSHEHVTIYEANT